LSSTLIVGLANTSNDQLVLSFSSVICSFRAGSLLAGIFSHPRKKFRDHIKIMVLFQSSRAVLATPKAIRSNILLSLTTAPVFVQQMYQILGLVMISRPITSVQATVPFGQFVIMMEIICRAGIGAIARWKSVD
jgi:hypothetical protein